MFVGFFAQNRGHLHLSSKFLSTALADFLAKPLVVAVLDILLKHYKDFDE